MAYKKPVPANRNGRSRLRPRLTMRETYRRLCSEAGVSFDDFMEAVKYRENETPIEWARRMSVLTDGLIKLKKEKHRGTGSRTGAPVQLSFLLVPNISSDGNDAPTDSRSEDSSLQGRP